MEVKKEQKILNDFRYFVYSGVATRDCVGILAQATIYFDALEKTANKHSLALLELIDLVRKADYIKKEDIR